MPLLVAGAMLVFLGLLVFGLTFFITFAPNPPPNLGWFRVASVSWSAAFALLTLRLVLLRSRQPDAYLFRSPWPAAAGWLLATLVILLLFFGVLVNA